MHPDTGRPMTVPASLMSAAELGAAE